jgi:hypothetical protein
MSVRFELEKGAARMDFVETEKQRQYRIDTNRPAPAVERARIDFESSSVVCFLPRDVCIAIHGKRVSARVFAVGSSFDLAGKERDFGVDAGTVIALHGCVIEVSESAGDEYLVISCGGLMIQIRTRILPMCLHEWALFVLSFSD